MDEQGKQLNSYSYDIWGGPVVTEETVPNVMRYAGEYWDDTTGLQYLRARWYDPGTARFMGEDTYEGTLTNPLSQNLYTYVHNNPLRYIDPSGHFAFETSDKVELKNLLDEAKEKSKSNRKNKYYKVYKDFIRDRYDFVSIMGENRYNYLFDLLTGTSPYTNNAGISSWARAQLLNEYQVSKEAEYIALLAMGFLPANGAGNKGLQNVYKSIKAAPLYPQGFIAAKNGTVKNKVNNTELLEELQAIEPGTWNKVYKDGVNANGKKISIHYFQSQSGQVFNVKVKNGWSNSSSQMPK